LAALPAVEMVSGELNWSTNPMTLLRRPACNVTAETTGPALFTASTFGTLVVRVVG
jgi:hypothetical protein